MGKDVERTGRRLMSVIPPFARIVGGSDATDVEYGDICIVVRTAGNRGTRKKPIQASRCQALVTHELAWVRTQARFFSEYA